MLQAIKAIYDNGKIEFLEQEPKGKYEVVLVFLEVLPEDELEDMVLAKQLNLETDYEQALTDLKNGKTTSSDKLRAKLKEKLVDQI